MSILSTREINGSVLEQIALRDSGSELPDQERMKRKRLLEQARRYRGTDFAGLFDHLDLGYCSYYAIESCLEELAELLKSNGSKNRVCILMRAFQQEEVEPVDLEPIQTLFAPFSIWDLPEGLPENELLDFKSEAEPDRKRLGWSEELKEGISRRDAGLTRLEIFEKYLIGGTVALCFLVIGVFVGYEVIRSSLAYLSNGTYLKWIGGVLFAVFLFYWFRERISSSEYLVVPGALVRRKARFFSSHWEVEAFTREDSLVAVLVDTVTGGEESGKVCVAQGRKNAFELKECFWIHWRSFLNVWFSPLPTPKGERLEDLR